MYVNANIIYKLHLSKSEKGEHDIPIINLRVWYIIRESIWLNQLIQKQNL